MLIFLFKNRHIVWTRYKDQCNLRISIEMSLQFDPYYVNCY